jgi:hypothetical protein
VKDVRSIERATLEKPYSAITSAPSTDSGKENSPYALPTL